MEQYLAQAMTLWNSPEFQALLVPVRTLSSVSAMFWMLARLTGLAMAGLKHLLFDELHSLLNFLYIIILSVVYAAMMFNTALQGGWHPSLLWREICGFGFMYVMLGITYTDRTTRELKPGTAAGFALGVFAYLFLANAPSVARQPALVELHRVLELFAAGGWGYLMTGLTALVMAWSLLHLVVSEIYFALSPLLYRLHIIKRLPVRFKFDKAGASDGAGVVPSLARSWFTLTLLLGAAGVAFYWWPKIKAAGEAAAPALQSRAQSPEAAAAAAKLKRVLPAVSFAAVNALPRGGAMADLALPVFRGLLSAPGEADRWLAAAALDRLDPAYRVSREELFRSSAAAELPCVWGKRSFLVLAQPLPGEAPDKAVTFWIADDNGLHFSGVGPGELAAVSGSGTCAVAAFKADAGAVLLAFTEAPGTPGGARQLWLSAYHPRKREVLSAVRAGSNGKGDFELAPALGGVSWADAPVSTAAAPCKGDCGSVLGAGVVSLATEPLAEYRSAAVTDGGIRVAPESALTYARSGLLKIYPSLPLFESVFRYDPVAGFLNRWYRLAVLADGRRCASAALDPALPGLETGANWTCDR